MKVAALIPALDPPPGLPGLVRRLAASDLALVVVVNDGSGPGFDPVFEEIAGIEKVRVVRHAVNLGKGAALKTGLNEAVCAAQDLSGVVTADADGQHLLEDILKVARALEAHPGSLVLGARTFDRSVPFRSRVGNTLTRFLFHILVGPKISDTQTGLRGIPRDLIPQLLGIDRNGYEFEFDMLLLAKHCRIPILEEPIRTVYIEGNRSSHFSPVRDSMRIYFVLLRSVLVSLATAALDFCIFTICLAVSAEFQYQTFLGKWDEILQAQVVARIFGGLFQYAMMKRAVFYSTKHHAWALPEYAALATVSMIISYSFIKLLMASLGLSPVPAKAISETLIYIGNFAVMRQFIFTGKRDD